MRDILFVSNEAEVPLCSTQITEEIFLKRLHIPSFVITYHKAGGGNIVHQRLEIK